MHTDQRLDIDSERNNHLFRMNHDIIKNFTERANSHIANLCKNGVLESKYEGKYNFCKILDELITMHYISVLDISIARIKELFSRHGVLFRLYDIHAVVHSYRGTAFIWIDKYYNECVFSVAFNPDILEPETLFRTGLFNKENELIDGDMFFDTVQLLDNGSVLPEWFLKSLKDIN